MPQLLLNMSILLQNLTVITKCDVYYKMPQYKHKNLRKQSNFFIQVLNASLHFTINKFDTSTHVEGTILHFTINKFDTSTHVEGTIYQPIFLNLLTELDFNSDNPYFYCILPKNIRDKFTIIRDLYRFLQPGLIFSVRLE